MNSAENESSALQNTELEFIKKSLLIQKSEILNKYREFKNLQTSSAKAADEVDAVVQNLQDNLNIQLHERDHQSLLLIENALSKFSSGTYGQCERCEDPIDVKRLKARPLATLCISCMEENENSRKTGRQLLQ